jgi:hypothetical protein
VRDLKIFLCFCCGACRTSRKRISRCENLFRSYRVSSKSPHQPKEKRRTETAASPRHCNHRRPHHPAHSLVARLTGRLRKLGVRSSKHLLRSRHVQHRLRQQFLEVAGVGDLHPAIARPPPVERRIADAVLPAQIARRKPGGVFLQDLMICSSVNLPLRIACLFAGEQKPNQNRGASGQQVRYLDQEGVRSTVHAGRAPKRLLAKLGPNDPLHP